ncbi:MAG: hypothetical protein HUU21_40945 [Polyangiaceae bacterium]|nr:hypothetical protein [Polyangiaceae bacterium]
MNDGGAAATTVKVLPGPAAAAGAGATSSGIAAATTIGMSEPLGARGVFLGPRAPKTAGNFDRGAWIHWDFGARRGLPAGS